MPPLDLAAADDRAAGARGLADRRRGRARRRPERAAGRAARGLRRRLVVGLWLFPRRPVVARRGVSGRRRHSSPGRCRSASSACRLVLALFPALGFAAGAPDLAPDATRVLALAVGLGAERMAARRRPHRLSLERARHGARRQSRARADRLARRPARADADRDRDLRRARDARDRDAPALERRACWRSSPSRRSAASAPGVSPRRRARPCRKSSCGSCSPISRRAPTSRPKTAKRSCSDYLALSDRATSPTTSSVADVTHLIWPESAFPFLLARDGAALARDRRVPARRNGADHRRRAPRRERRSDDRRHFYNSILILNRQGLLPERYDKRHLVPFGEYLPLRQLVRADRHHPVRPCARRLRSGRRRATICIFPACRPREALICYEAIFPNERGARSSDDGDPPRWLLNVTDDAWFGRTAGPYQHFAQARLRAIETGLPLVRAANTGISAVLDGRGTRARRGAARRRSRARQRACPSRCPRPGSDAGARRLAPA